MGAKKLRLFFAIFGWVQYKSYFFNFRRQSCRESRLQGKSLAANLTMKESLDFFEILTHTRYTNNLVRF